MVLARPGCATGLPGGIHAVGLSKRFGPVQALAGVDLDLEPGEVVAVLGRNGAGKSTLIRILATSVLPDGGRAWVAGADVVADAATVRRHIGLVLGEDRSFFWRLSGRSNLEFFAALHGMRRTEARQAAEAALSAVGLVETSDRRVDRYSTGMRSRLGIGRALLGSPSVLLLDEPTRSLDPLASAGVRDLVRTLCAERSVSVLLATHDLHEAAALASRVIIMSDGRVRSRSSGRVDAAELEAALLGHTP